MEVVVVVVVVVVVAVVVVVVVVVVAVVVVVVVVVGRSFGEGPTGVCEVNARPIRDQRRTPPPSPLVSMPEGENSVVSIY